MNQKNNYNSIVFLTTLSVYLGLVLVGGAAPVLAHSAMTRDFDIKNEIVFEDDLDKKPDDELAKAIEIVKGFKIAEALIEFFAKLEEHERLGNYDSIRDCCFLHKSELEEFGYTARQSLVSTIEADWLAELAENLILTAQPKNTTTISDWTEKINKISSRKSSVEIEANLLDFSIAFGFDKQSSESAKLAAKSFQEIFVRKKLESKSSFEIFIYENTKVISENNQIFIVTRLPRGSIDALLAEKNAR